MKNVKLLGIAAISFLAGTILTSTQVHQALATNPTLSDIMTTLSSIQAQLTGIQTTDNAIKAKTDNLPSDPASNTAISNAQSTVISTVTTTPKTIVLFRDLSTNSLSSGNCAVVVTADSGKTMIGTMEVLLPAAGSGTSLEVDQSSTGNPPFTELLRQKNFNTAENDYDISFTGKTVRVCNGSFATANTGTITIEGSAIQVPSS